jgi:hypothetical protein
MEKQIVLADQFAEIDVDCPPEAVPAREAFFLLALDVPKRIAHVLEIEPDTSLLQARSFAVPLSEQMAVWALAGFMAVRPTECFFLLDLGIRGSRENARAE